LIAESVRVISSVSSRGLAGENPRETTDFGGDSMRRLVVALLAFPFAFGQVVAQSLPNPPVITKMEELGSVYVTRAAPKDKTAPKTKAKENAIIGIDFRPMAGTDSKKIAELVKELATLPDLETLLLLGMDVTDAAADAIPASAKVTKIQFFNTTISDKGIAKLTRFTNLESFKFTGGGLTDEGMKTLGTMKTLHTIEITDAKITDAGVLALSSLPNLRVMTIETSAATQQSVDQLQQRLPRIEGRRFLR
jgi:hypothetical protein